MLFMEDNYCNYVETEILEFLYEYNSSDFLLKPRIVEKGNRVAFDYYKVCAGGERVRITLAELPVFQLNKMTALEKEDNLALLAEKISEEKKITSFDRNVLHTICKQLTMFNCYEQCIEIPYGEFVESLFEEDIFGNEEAFIKVEASLKKLSDYFITYTVEDGNRNVSGKQNAYLSGYDIRRYNGKVADLAEDYYYAELIVCLSSYLRKWWESQDRKLTADEERWYSSERIFEGW